MRQFNYMTSALAVILTATGLSVPASAALPSVARKADITKQQDPVKPVRPYQTKKLWGIDALNQTDNALRLNKRTSAIKEPDKILSNLSYFDYIEAPDGSMWFYEATYETERVEVSEWYSETYIKAFNFDIYDSDFNKIGSIYDSIELGEHETRVASAVLDPAVTTTFFNQDDKPELIVYVAINTEYYTNNYYNFVYTLGGEKDENGYDKPIMTINGRCVDAFNAAAPGEPENFYLSFVGEEGSEDLNADYDDFIDFLNSYCMPVTIYSKAVDENGPVEVYSKKIYSTRIPGDTTDGIYLISKPVNGQAYFIFSQYEKPYFIDPTGGALNEDPTPDNALVIEVVKVDNGQASPVSTTKIPVVQEIGIDQLMYTFYSIGSVGWKNDVDMTVNGTPEAPAFLVARDVMNAATYEEEITSFEIYGNDGKFVHEIASNTDGIVVFDSKPGEEPTALFVVINDEAYEFMVRGLYSGDHLFSLNQDNGGDPISAVCNRMLTKDGYKYAFEMTYYELDDENNEYMRVAWFNNDGSFDRIDKINMGKDVMAGSVNLYSESLNPYLYDDDDAMEYAVLVKRSNGVTIKNEFIVADDSGDWYANFTENEGKGYPRVFTIFPGKVNRLVMVYEDYGGNLIEIYDLPFIGEPNVGPDDEPGVDGIESIVGELNGVTFANNIVSAQGQSIQMFTTAGAPAAKGYNEVSVESLPTGVYVVVATDAKGNKTTAKIMKR